MPSDAVIGSSQTCDFPIAFDEVSKRHCRIIFEDGYVWVEDLNSTNGTYVDGEEVRPRTRKRLYPASELTLARDVSLSWDDIQSLKSEKHPKEPRQQQPDAKLEAANQDLKRKSPKSSNRKREVRYAGFWLRSFALLIDAVILAVVGGLIGAMYGAIYGAYLSSHASSAQIAELVAARFLPIQIISTVVGWLYMALFESSDRQATPGKMALGIEVCDLDGNRIGFWHATGRYLGKIVSGLILLIGYFMAGFTEKKQALHDIMAGCLVVREN